MNSIQISPFINPDRQFLLSQIKFDKKIKKAKGAYLYEENGQPILDFLAQYGAVPFGHNPDDLLEVIKREFNECTPGFIQPFVTDSSTRLAKRLIELTPGKFQYVIFTNSGTETVEAAIKLARCATKRPVILSANNGFHGKTMGAVSATGNPVYSEPFLVDTQHFDKVPFNDLAALDQRLQKGDVAAFIVEPIQGESGMRTPSKNYISHAAKLCHQYGTLIIVDEIQTGLGRTGSLFAIEHEADANEIDILLLSKALGGGVVPIGAMLCTKEIWREEFGLYHSSTFSSNGVICEIALAALEKLVSNNYAIVENARIMGEYFKDKLQHLVENYPIAFSKVDGKGLMLGLSINPQSWNKSMFLTHVDSLGFVPALISGHLLEYHHILTAPVTNKGNVLRLEPALTVTSEQIDVVINALEEVAILITRSRFHELLAYVANEEKNTQSLDEISINNNSLVDNCDIFVLDNTKCSGSFAFLIHPLDDQVLFESLPSSIQQLGTKENWMDWMKLWTKKFYSPARVNSFPVGGDGRWIMGHLIASPLTPHQMMRLGKLDREALINEYLNVAKSLDVDIVGLGAFTSVISRSGREAINKGVNITTGNSLTAIASANALIKACKQKNVDIANERVAVIGAAGSIGRVLSLRLAEQAKNLILLGNPNNPNAQDKLMSVVGEMYWRALRVDRHAKQHELGIYLTKLLGQKQVDELLQSFDGEDFEILAQNINRIFLDKLGMNPPVSVSVDVKKELGNCLIVISATSAGKSFIDSSWLKSGAVICDVSRPLDFMESVAHERKDVFVFEGGILHYPQSLKFGSEDVLGFPAGINLACLGETVAMCIRDTKRDYSIGERLDYQEACEIYDFAKKTGFEEAIYRDSKIYTGNDLNQIDNRVRKNSGH